MRARERERERERGEERERTREGLLRRFWIRSASKEARVCVTIVREKRKEKKKNAALVRFCPSIEGH